MKIKNNAKKALAGLFVLGLSSLGLSNAQTLTSAPAKSGFYVGINGGYNFPITTKGSPYFYANDETVQSGPNIVEVVPFSLGKGPSVGVDFGYMFTSNIGAELGIDYLFGSKTTFTETDKDFPSYRAEQSISGKMLQFKPAVVFTAGAGNVKPYAKAGIVIGVAGKITSEYEVREPDANYSRDWYEEYNGGAAVGFHGALGIDYALNNQLSLFGEVTAIGLNYSPDKGEVTKAIENGEDYLNSLNVSDREIEFVDRTDGTAQSDNQPRKELKFSAPFSNVGLNVGVKYHF
ncbi:outer membrane beta-barrel protein [Chryseobacterium camelliae]|uniref:Outer membrane beta-barrel protein n=1 Tax=Chryseobacterium camelliae TaxID=1265445 RepID=A0ABY7QJD9_9FLAO|nr:outer membrane beta-barrel protein [Chryseobacterium camelliae]WBV59249.1 outer membrane beta-barrel protein [Chryseobacterium camelliae]